jgi:uncharacterized cupredoxin-like copper-binding protein
MTASRIAATQPDRRFARSRFGVWAVGLLLLVGCSAGVPAASRIAASDVRVITIELMDFEFVPAVIDARPGEDVRLILVNRSELPHEVFIGAPEDQDRHHALHLAAPPEMQDRLDEGSTGIYVPGRGTAQLLYRARHAGDLVIGCHLIGHFEAGMRGVMRIRGG